MHVIPSLPTSVLELCPLLLEDVVPLFPLAVVVLLLGVVAVLLGAVAVLLLVAATVAPPLLLLPLVVVLAAVGLASTDGRLSDPLVAIALPVSVQW